MICLSITRRVLVSLLNASSISTGLDLSPTRMYHLTKHAFHICYQVRFNPAPQTPDFLRLILHPIGAAVSGVYILRSMYFLSPIGKLGYVYTGPCPSPILFCCCCWNQRCFGGWTPKSRGDRLSVPSGREAQKETLGRKRPYFESLPLYYWSAKKQQQKIFEPNLPRCRFGNWW